MKKIGTFNAPKGKYTDYKSNDAYFEAVYNRNWQRIKKVGFTKDKFKYQLNSLVKYEGLTKRQAVKAMSRTYTFMSKKEHALENIKNTMNKKLSYEIRKEMGSMTKKIQWDKLKYNQDTETFYYEKYNRKNKEYEKVFELEFIEDEQYHEDEPIVRLVKNK